MTIGKAYHPVVMDVEVRDPASGIIILPMVRQLAANTIAVQATIDEYVVTLTSATGFAVGQHFRIINAEADRFYFGTILEINANILTLDTPLDFTYVVGSEVTGSTTNMNVNGSVTPVVFTLRTGAPSIPSIVDITRLLITCTTASAIDLSKFGDLAALVHGIVLRWVNGITQNIFNVKSNADITNISFDFNVFVATNPSQGIDGFTSRLTFAGQNKMGSVIRLGQDDNLELIVQDDLTGLTSLSIVLEGHVAQRGVL